MMQNLIIRIFTLCLVVMLGFVAANAENFQTIINNGSSQNRVDIAILGDGYTSAQMAQYESNVQQFIQSVFAQEPYREYKRYYNVHRIDVISNQSGADHPDRIPQVFVDTALDATYNCANSQRLICVNNTKVNQVISRTLPASHFEVILVIVNDSEYGGSGGSVAVASTNQSAVELILHEVGHSFGLLTDEYEGGGPSCNPNVEPFEPNATRQIDRNLIKWKHWIAETTPIPTTAMTAGLPGLFVGSKYCSAGLYRPTYDSKMRTLNRPFEQINTEQHVKRIYNFVSPLDLSLPSASAVTLTAVQSQTFSVSTPIPLTHNLSIEWFVDGQASGSGNTFTLNGSALSPGSHIVKAAVTDLTPFVRNDPQQLLSATRTWNINVQTSGARAKFDFDGDGKTDVSVFRPDNGMWYLLQSANGFTGVQFGLSTDKIVPADFDGDGKTDIAVYRDGTWYLQRSQVGFIGISFGASTDIPVPKDFDGDGKAELAVYRPSNGTWYFYNLATNQTNGVSFGASEDKPVPADYDGDAKADVAVFRPSNGTWYLQSSKLGGFTGIQFGEAADKPVPADFDGDGKADVAVFRPSNGTWYQQRSALGFTGVQFGVGMDTPTPGDYDGDGKTDVAVFRSGTWYLQKSRDGFTGVAFGNPTDKLVPNAFVP